MFLGSDKKPTHSRLQILLIILRMGQPAFPCSSFGVEDTGGQTQWWRLGARGGLLRARGATST